MANRSGGADLPHFVSQQPLVGWRGWSIVHPHFLFTNNTVWLPGERAEAICTVHYHPEGERIPVAECSCGIYAFTTPYAVKEQGYTIQMLLGEVWLWGKVIEHEQGYKAEFAYPKKFYAKSRELFDQDGTSMPQIGHIPDRNTRYLKYRELAEFVAFRYGVPIEVADKQHPIYLVTPEEQRRRAELERKRRLEIAQERAMRRKKNEQMQLAARNLPPTVQGKGYKTLWEQICAEADQLVRERLDGKKKGNRP